MARPKKVTEPPVERVTEKKTENGIKSNDRYKVESIKGVDDILSITDTKNNIVFEYKVICNTYNLRPLNEISHGDLKQSINDFNMFIENQIW